MIEHKNIMYIAEMRRLEREIKLFELEERETYLLIMGMNDWDCSEMTLDEIKWKRELCCRRIRKYEKSRDNLMRNIRTHLQRYPNRNASRYERLMECLPESPIHQCV